jgi:RNA recognition motif-containing protein
MASHTLFVSNFPFTTTEEELRAAFDPICTISGVRMIMDRETGRSRGYAFVEVPDDDAVERSIEELNETEFRGRRLVVSRAKGRSAVEPPLRHRIVIEWSDASNAYTAEVPSLGVCLSAPTLEAAVRQLRTRVQTQGGHALATSA